MLNNFFQALAGRRHPSSAPTHFTCRKNRSSGFSIAAARYQCYKTIKSLFYFRISDLTKLKTYLENSNMINSSWSLVVLFNQSWFVSFQIWTSVSRHTMEIWAPLVPQTLSKIQPKLQTWPNTWERKDSHWRNSKQSGLELINPWLSLSNKICRKVSWSFR